MPTKTKTIVTFEITARPGDSPEVDPTRCFWRAVPLSDQPSLIAAARDMAQEYVKASEESLMTSLDLEACRASVFSEILGKLSGWVPELDSPRLYAKDYTSATAWVTSFRVLADLGDTR